MLAGSETLTFWGSSDLVAKKGVAELIVFSIKNLAGYSLG
jgi:hypothetical protein